MDNQDFPIVILVNSKPETLFSLRHFEYLIEREMGHDAATFFHRVVEEYEDKGQQPSGGKRVALR